MNDIVERLAGPFIAEPAAQRVMDDAADEIERLRAALRDGVTETLDYLGQVGQLSEELERVKREAERAQDAHGVRFLNYLEETARLADEIERLRAALRDIMLDSGSIYAIEVARAALEPQQ